MPSAAWLALSDILTPPFRAVLWKSLALTLALLFVVWLGLQALAVHLAALSGQFWIETAIAILTGFGLLLGLAFLVAPVSALMAGLFSDDIAATVERTHYPQDRPGVGLSLATSLRGTLAFTLTAILVNLVCLLLLLVPGVNLVAFFVGNGYLLGREFFENVAARFMPLEAARKFRGDNAVTVFLGGLLIALFLAIPIVNLLTPLFATAFMTHLYKYLTGSRPAERTATG